MDQHEKTGSPIQQPRPDEHPEFYLAQEVARLTMQTAALKAALARAQNDRTKMLGQVEGLQHQLKGALSKIEGLQEHIDALRKDKGPEPSDEDDADNGTKPSDADAED